MKYKIGDKVKIKNDLAFNERATSWLSFLNPERVTMVKRIINNKYLLEGLVNLEWEEDWLEVVHEPIQNRFEILDL